MIGVCLIRVGCYRTVVAAILLSVAIAILLILISIARTAIANISNPITVIVSLPRVGNKRTVVMTPPYPIAINIIKEATCGIADITNKIIIIIFLTWIGTIPVITGSNRLRWDCYSLTSDTGAVITDIAITIPIGIPLICIGIQRTVIALIPNSISISVTLASYTVFCRGNSVIISS